LFKEGKDYVVLELSCGQPLETEGIHKAINESDFSTPSKSAMHEHVELVALHDCLVSRAVMAFDD